MSFVVGDSPTITQQIAVPVFAPTYAAVTRLDRSNTTLHIIIRAWEVVEIVAVDQVFPQMLGHMQKVLQAVPLGRGQCRVLHLVVERAAPGVKTLPNGCIG